MEHTVTESIFDGKSVVIPLADVQHFEKHANNSVPGIMVITKHTRWDCDRDVWANGIWISESEGAQAFRSAWCRYRSELEAGTLMDLTPAANYSDAELNIAISRMETILDGARNSNHAAEVALEKADRALTGPTS